MMKLQSRRLPFYKDGHPHLAAQVKSTAKNMQKEDGKPHQPVQLKKRRWALGDVTEVLDLNSWRLGKITEVLKNDCFIIRLAGCNQPREFHISCLRIPHAYYSKQLAVADMDCQAYEEDDQYNKRKAASVCASTSARTVRRKLDASRIVKTAGKKQKVAAYEVHQLTKTVLPPKVSVRNNIDGDRIYRPISGRYNNLTKNKIIKMKPDCKVLPSSEIPLHIREENECSVASCSANHFEYCTDDDQQSVGIGSCLPDDIMSARRSVSEQENDNACGFGLHMNVHELELQAYQSTVKAFHAAGPLTWEQESLLTNLRLSLNISNEEHLLQLRHLLSL